MNDEQWILSNEQGSMINDTWIMNDEKWTMSNEK
jgi:hypothetical protein